MFRYYPIRIRAPFRRRSRQVSFREKKFPFGRDPISCVLGAAATYYREYLAQRLDRQEQAPSPPHTTPQKAQVRVLVVEDEPLILMSTVDMLGELGHIAHEACSAEEALATLEAEAVDVLLTDVGLPNMSGTDLAIVVRDRWPTVRIVFASGDDSARLASGILDALQLSKPFTMEGLKGVLIDASARKKSVL